MIIRRALSFGANLVAGALLSTLAVALVRACRHGRDRLEPRDRPAPEAATAPPAGEPPSGSAAS